MSRYIRLDFCQQCLRLLPASFQVWSHGEFKNTEKRNGCLSRSLTCLASTWASISTTWSIRSSRFREVGTYWFGVESSTVATARSRFRWSKTLEKCRRRCIFSFEIELTSVTISRLSIARERATLTRLHIFKKPSLSEVTRSGIMTDAWLPCIASKVRTLHDSLQAWVTAYFRANWKEK